MAQRRNVKYSKIWREIEAVLDRVANSDEDTSTILLTIAPKDPELQQYRNPDVALLTMLRKQIRKRGLGNRLEVVVRNGLLHLCGKTEYPN